MKSNRLTELDAIRGVAALVVVIYHYFFRYNEIYGHSSDLLYEWAYIGKYGVQLFFIVSGFVIYWTLNKVDHPMDFVISRFSRLYPTYWFSALLTFTVVFFLGLPGREISGEQALMNILMFHQYLGFKHIDGVYWTLTVELTFYFWAFISFITGTLKYIEFMLGLLLAITVLQHYEIIELSNGWKRILLVGHIPYFLSGICFYKLKNNAKVHTIITLSLCLITIFITYTFSEFVLSFFFYIFFYLAINKRLTFFPIDSFAFIGGISYALYLIHQNIGYVIIRELYKMQIDPLISISIALSSSLILATLITNYIDRPSQKFIRGFYRKYKDKYLFVKE